MITPPATPRRRAVVPALLACVLATAVTGCTSNDDSTPAPTRSTGPTPTTVAPATTRATTPAAKATAVDAKGGVGARADLKAVACKADASGAWSITGDLANPTTSAQKYTVEASVVNPDGWAVDGATKLQVEVPAKETKSLSAKAFHKTRPAAARTMQCVTRVVRHPA